MRLAMQLEMHSGINRAIYLHQYYGRRLRVTTKDGEVYIGRVEIWTEESLRFQEDGGPLIRFAFNPQGGSDIRSVELAS